MKMPSRPFFLGLANTLLHLNSVLKAPLASRLRKEPLQETSRPFLFVLSRQRRQ